MSYLKLDHKTILLLGSGRSGTSWLCDLLASPFRYRLLFEPFHTAHVPDSELAADRYYSPDSVPPPAARFIHRALNDEINSPWIAQSSNRRFNMHRWRFWPKVNIVKEVRANLLIPALRALFGPDLPILVLIRHPGAVVESFLRVEFPWSFDVSTLMAQDGLQRDYGVPIDRLRPYITNLAGQLAVRWVIENSYLLRCAATLDLDIIFYEDLVQDRVGYVRHLCTRYKLHEPPNLEENARRLSGTTHKRSPWYEGAGASGWRQRLSPNDIEQIEAVLEAAGVNYPK